MAAPVDTHVFGSTIPKFVSFPLHSLSIFCRKRQLLMLPTMRIMSMSPQPSPASSSRLQQ